jgi:hypothetical protein
MKRCTVSDYINSGRTHRLSLNDGMSVKRASRKIRQVIVFRWRFTSVSKGRTAFIFRVEDVVRNQ